jgi:hypothetical protein
MKKIISNKVKQLIPMNNDKFAPIEIKTSTIPKINSLL